MNFVKEEWIMKTLKFIPILIFLVYGGVASADTDIIDTDPPVDEKGQVWNQPSATITGQGSLKFSNYSGRHHLDATNKMILYPLPHKSI